MELQENTSTHIRQLLQQPQWKALEYAAQQYVMMLRSQPRMKSTVDETLMATLLLEGQIKGIDDFIRELYSSI